jgi:hypothetical protein
MTHRWLLFLGHLPATSSSARVALWRRLRAAGAASLEHGTWVLPENDGHAKLFAELAETVRHQGGSVSIFVGNVVGGDDDAIAQFQADRAREYDEFHTRADALLAEIAKETAAGKFMFAELEEIEDDFEKHRAWLAKIDARDFFKDARSEQARLKLVDCAEALSAFSQTVYDAESPAVKGGTITVGSK